MDLEQRVANLEAPYISQAFSIIGTGFTYRSRHLAAVGFLERALRVDPSNTHARRNLVNTCNKAGKEVLRRDVSAWATEIDYEITLGIEQGGLLLREYGVKDDQVQGQASVKVFQEDPKTSNTVMGALSNVASLLYKRGRDQIHDKGDFTGGSKTLTRSIRHCQTILAVAGLPRSLPEVEKTISAKKGALHGTINHPTWALGNIGNCYHMLGELDTAELAFNLALELDPKYRMASDKLEVVRRDRDSQKPFEESKVDSLDVEPIIKIKPPPWEQIETALELKRSTLRLSDSPFEHLSGDLVLREARLTAAVLQDMSENPSHAESLLTFAEEREGAFWTGLNAANMPEFTRLNVLIDHVTSNPESYGEDVAGRAEPLAQRYRDIRGSMIMPAYPDDLEGLTGEAETLYELFSKV